MLDDTPRTFVGRASFAVAGMCCRTCAVVVAHEILATDGVTGVLADCATRTVTVTVDRPMDRNDIASAARRASAPAGLHPNSDED
jgi:copper chaperone CopZ